MTRPLTVVTGGTRGIGAATALRLAADGHDLVLGFAGDVAAAEKTAARVREAGAACRVVQVDVADADQVDALFDAAAEQGPVTGLVNNAGATLHSAPLADTPVDVVRRVVEVNLTGAILVARRAAQVLGEGGSIVNVSSAAATLGSPGEYVHYAAAKAGVETLTKGLAVELAPRGIRVNAVAPGIIRTDIHAAAGDPDRVERVAPSVPMGRAGEPDEVAEAIAWLMGPASSYTTGSVIRVAGGR
jgi:glucose 1-dehydrogenase